MSIALQSHPPIELAIGLLPSAEQSHAQVSMRVLAAHLKVPCVVVPQATGDIVLKPCERDPGNLCLVSAYGEAHLERPMRLVPLSEALSGLIDGILARGGGQRVDGLAADTATEAAPPAQPAAHVREAAVAADESLLALLLGRTRQGPLEIGLRSGHSLLLDARYATAYLSAAPVELLPRLAYDAIVCIHTLEAGEFTSRIAADMLEPVSVEQLCWSLAAIEDSTPMLARWHQDESARISLDTWPNLSAQHDSLAWLGVLARLSRRNMRLDEVRQAAIAAGIPPARARHGLSLLLAYRHARVIASLTAADTVVVPISQARRAPEAAPSGLLGRLRSRLRALAA